MELSERKKQILRAVVENYIQTAEPVGSKAIVASAGLKVSSATIRNEMAELENLGYLEQPHTSAGRIPSPKGYRLYVNELMERQRLSIARAMMKDAPIIILDEATANVDPENEKELMDAISELTHEKTVIMIAHRLKTVRSADQIIVVDKGRIVQRGTHKELMQADGIYRSFVTGREKAVGWKL